MQNCQPAERLSVCDLSKLLEELNSFHDPRGSINGRFGVARAAPIFGPISPVSAEQAGDAVIKAERSEVGRAASRPAGPLTTVGVAGRNARLVGAVLAQPQPDPEDLNLEAHDVEEAALGRDLLRQGREREHETESVVKIYINIFLRYDNYPICQAHWSLTEAELSDRRRGGGSRCLAGTSAGGCDPARPPVRGRSLRCCGCAVSDRQARGTARRQTVTARPKPRLLRLGLARTGATRP
jgi:hypothetical protein